MKIPFQSRAAAITYYKEMKRSARGREGPGNGPIRRMTAYECHSCGKWHLTTSHKKKVTRAIERKRRKR
jgi:hypothetical protein